MAVHQIRHPPGVIQPCVHFQPVPGFENAMFFPAGPADPLTEIHGSVDNDPDGTHAAGGLQLLLVLNRHEVIENDYMTLEEDYGKLLEEVF